MILGASAIVLSIDDARKLLAAAKGEWTRKRMEQLQRQDRFLAVTRLDDLIREHDRIQEK